MSHISEVLLLQIPTLFPHTVRERASEGMDSYRRAKRMDTTHPWSSTSSGAVVQGGAQSVSRSCQGTTKCSSRGAVRCSRTDDSSFSGCEHSEVIAHQCGLLRVRVGEPSHPESQRSRLMEGRDVERKISRCRSRSHNEVRATLQGKSN